jgi:hypothetical protein
MNPPTGGEKGGMATEIHPFTTFSQKINVSLESH